MPPICAGGRQEAMPTDETIRSDLIRWTRKVAIFTGVLAGVTFLLVVANIIANVFIYQQWHVASQAQEDSRAQLRALVTIGGGQITITNDKDGNPKYYSFMPLFQNFGSTRTNKFNAWYNIHYFPGKVPDNMDFSKPMEQISTTTIIIGPNSAPLVQPVTVGREEIEHALHGDGAIIIWGHAEYSDVFSPNDVRTVGFCFLLTPTTNTTNGQIAINPTSYRNDCNNTGSP